MSRVLAALAIILLLPTARVQAQQLGGLPRGTVVERVTSVTDTAQHYAVYLPAAYDSTRVWPLAILMDPRGRALIPMRLAQEAAERYGYILISSYNTISDSIAQPNVDAFNAIMADARGSLRMDPTRIYLVGFSGTARLAWNFSVAPGVAGIFGAGGSGMFFAQTYMAEVKRIPYYGIAGRTDFNWSELHMFEPWLERVGVPRRLRSFSGAHQWPPAWAMMEAFGWFELRHMATSGVRNDTLISRLLARDRAAADSLEDARLLAEAFDRRREIVADYTGLVDVSADSVRLARMENDRRVRDARAQRQAELADFAAFDIALQRWLEHLRDPAASPDVDDGMDLLDIRALQREARSRDVLRAAAAQRKLEQAAVHLSYYLPRDFLKAGDAARALLVLEMADRVKPDAPAVSLLRARALLALTRREEALDALADAVRRGLSPAVFRNDPAFAGLHEDPRWAALFPAR